MLLADWPFLLIFLIPVLLFPWVRRRSAPARLRFPLAIPPEAKTWNPTPWLLGLKLIALAFFVFALSRPQFGTQERLRTVSGVDILMVMDVSASMAAIDLSERSRFDVAKQTMRQFIEGRRNDRIGFVVFSGEPLTLAPLTLDYGIVLNALDGAAMGILKDGTAIGDGLSLAIHRIRESKAKSRVIILLTDGDNNVGQVDPATAGEIASGHGIRVYTIAIGKEGRVKIPITHRNAFGQVATTYQWQENALNTELLQKIAETTKGKFYRVTDEKTLQEVFAEIDQLERSEIKSEERVRYEEKFSWPVLAGLLLLALERILAVGVWRVFP